MKIVVDDVLTVIFLSIVVVIMLAGLVAVVCEHTHDNSTFNEILNDQTILYLSNNERAVVKFSDDMLIITGEHCITKTLTIDLFDKDYSYGINFDGDVDRSNYNENNYQLVTDIQKIKGVESVTVQQYSININKFDGYDWKKDKIKIQVIDLLKKYWCNP